MSKQMNRHSQRGYNILEVLMGIAIFAIGMLALASLQGNLTRSATDANLRTTAINLAEGLLENRRGFARLTDPTNTYPAYDDIVTGSTTIVRSGVSYNIATTVTDYYYNLATDSFTTTAPSGALFSDYKQVVVNVSWASSDIRAQEGVELDMNVFNTACAANNNCITLTDTISSITTASAAKGVIQTEENYTPLAITYTPGLNPDIVALSLGNNKFKESLTPEPDVIRLDELVDTRFDVITYSQTASGAFFVRREEFAAVSCECTLKAPPGTPESAGRRPVIWAGDEYVRGHFVNKPYGESANNQQSTLCTQCCRDHHDGGSSADDASDTAVNKVYPFRPVTDYFTSGTFNGDHKHYNITNQGVLELADAVNDTYLEACRLVRVDGFFRLAQDFRQEDRHIFPADFLDDDAEIATYSSYVTTAANDYENASYPDYEVAPPCIGGPSPCVEEPTYGADYPTALGAGEFPVWTQLPLGGNSTQQLRSRGIYIDYLSFDMRTVVDCFRADATRTADDCQSGDVILDRNTSTQILELIPFFDVQLTKLNRWTETPTNIPVDTTNEGLADDNTHSRGVASKSTLGCSDVEASGHRGNLGFTDTQPIDSSFLSNVNADTIEVQALDNSGNGGCSPGPGNNPTISGNITEGINGIQVTDITVSGTGGALCDRTPAGFECEIPAGASNPRVTISGYGKQNADGYACISPNTLPIVNQVLRSGASTNAHITYDLSQSPTPGSGYNVHIQTTACST